MAAGDTFLTPSRYGIGGSGGAPMTQAALGGAGMSGLMGGGGAGLGGAMGIVGGGIEALGGLTQTALGIAQAFDDPGYEAGILPQEFQIGLVRQVTDQLNYINKSMKTMQNLYKTYDNRIKLADQWTQGQIPSADAMKALSASGMELAQQLGMSPQDMVKQGLIQPGEETALQRIHDIAFQGTGYRGDAVAENKIQEQRRQLQQQISSLPASQQAIAMQQFENNANLMRQQAGQQQIEALTGFLGAGQQSLNAIQGQLGFANQLQGQSLGLAGQRYGLGAQNIQNQLGLYGAGMNAYQNLSQFGLSDEVRALVQAGVIGPGTSAQQTGVPLQMAADVQERVAQQDIVRFQPRLGAFDRASNNPNINRFVRWNTAPTGTLMGRGPTPQPYDDRAEMWANARNQIRSTYGTRR